MTDAADRICAKFDIVLKKLDDLNVKIREVRRYDNYTALLVIILWGIGLPLVLFSSLIYAAHH